MECIILANSHETSLLILKYLLYVSVSEGMSNVRGAVQVEATTSPQTSYISV